MRLALICDTTSVRVGSAAPRADLLEKVMHHENRVAPGSIIRDGFKKRFKIVNAQSNCSNPREEVMTLIAEDQSTEAEYPADRAIDLPSPSVAPEFLRFVAHAVILSKSTAGAWR
jgi:hypothetical protein